jgi:hypothetical protein
MPPISAPVTVPQARIAQRRACPRSSRRYPIAPLRLPGTRPIVLETFAVTDG